MIYWWTNPSIKYAGYLGKTDKYERMMCWYDAIIGDPLPPLDKWETPVLTQYLGEEWKKRKPCKVTDVVRSGSTHLISEKAKNALADIWEKHATLYPVTLDDSNEPYYMVVVHTVIDCIDRERTIGDIQKYGKNKGKGYFSALKKWVMREEEVGDNYLFLTPDMETRIFATEAFKQRVIESGLTGFGLVKEAYDEDPFIS
ncbi:imm11 family protein [Otariodibacter oris]|uniref:Immunity MXAN-0049 protein domain-containing protein n=1 Tax=Otariodibacter oris TaxID=1032623 RepID=A0A420XGT2_9PAST|nr:DUF1629 domain-containing protein [Otariodibacter oris]QGM81193.1 hypothetical protein A6A10_07130 [Otariodibacter oris]RKR72753.1 hypothetical protein DES31_0918 [Otariodibacter oris]